MRSLQQRRIQPANIKLEGWWAVGEDDDEGRGEGGREGEGLTVMDTRVLLPNNFVKCGA